MSYINFIKRNCIGIIFEISMGRCSLICMNNLNNRLRKHFSLYRIINEPFWLTKNYKPIKITHN